MIEEFCKRKFIATLRKQTRGTSSVNQNYKNILENKKQMESECWFEKATLNPDNGGNN